MDFVRVVGKVQHVTPTDGRRFSDVQLGVNNWVYFQPDEMSPKKGDWIECKCVLDEKNRRVVVGARWLTKMESDSLESAQFEKLEAQSVTPDYVGKLDSESKKFSACWFDALRILGFRYPEKFKAIDEPELAKTVYKIAFTLFNKINSV